MVSPRTEFAQHGRRHPVFCLYLNIVLYVLVLLRILQKDLAGDFTCSPSEFSTAQQHEAERRLKMLGELAEQKYDYDTFRARAKAIRLPLQLLKSWHTSYRQEGIAGLVPDEFEELNERSWRTAIHRYVKLQDLLDVEVITDEALQAKANEFNKAGVNLGTKNTTWTARRVWDWCKRYRQSGLWGLAPEFYSGLPSQAKKKQFTPLRSSGSLSPKDLAIMEERLDCLGDLRSRETATNAELDSRGREVGKSRRTLRNWHTAYQKYGFLGLAPKGERSDKYQHHGSEWITEITEGIRLSHPDWSLRAIHEEVCKRARRRGEPEPSLWKVRSICNNIPKATRHIADKRYNDFRNGYRISGQIIYNDVIYQLDHTRVDVLVKDLRNDATRRKSGLVRPWLTVCIDSRSRLIVAAIFGYDQPNRHTVAAALRDALLTSDTKPRGGVPKEVRVDHGSDLLADHIEKLARGIDFELKPMYLPEHKGIVERFFRTLNERLWRQLPGYVDSNVAERNPNAEKSATLSVKELDEKFWEFVAVYHNEEHSETGMTPMDCWDTYCVTDEVDPRELDLLLYEETNECVIGKKGIRYKNRFYWNARFSRVTRMKVTLRVAPTAYAPDTVEVFYKRKWFCTAFAIDSEIATREMTGDIVQEAQADQRAYHTDQIRQARLVVKEDDQQIAEEAKAEQKATSVKSKNAPESQKDHSVLPPLQTRRTKRNPTLALFSEASNSSSGENNE